MTSYNNAAFLSVLTHMGTTGPNSNTKGLFSEPVITNCTAGSGGINANEVVSPRISSWDYDAATGQLRAGTVQGGAQTGQDLNGIRGVALADAAQGETVPVLWMGVVTVKAATSTAATSPLTHDRTGDAEASLASTGEGVWGYAITAESGGTLTAFWCCLPVFGTKA